VATEDGWRSVIHGCKEDKENGRLDEDKRWDLKEKKGRLLVRRKGSFWMVRKSLQDR